MDVVAPHMKKGKKPKFEDHVVKWGGSRKSKRRQSPEEMLRIAQGIQRQYDRRPKRASRQRARYQVRDKGGLPRVVDSRTGKTEWSGLDREMAKEVAAGLNST